jgi:predicted PurR-regulated permease PerM
MSTAQKAIFRERRIKLFFFLGALVLLVTALTLIKNVFISFLLAFVVFYILSPLVSFLERRGLSRQMATTIPFLVLTIVTLVAVNIFLPILISQIALLKVNLPQYLDAMTKFLLNTESQLTAFASPIYPMDIRGQLQPKMMSMAQGLFENLPTYISQSLTIFLLTPFLAYFLLVDGQDFRRKILALVPNNLFELALHLNYQINLQMGGFVRARIFESFLVGSVVFAGLLFFDFPYALILAFFAGVMNIIPYVGPFIGAIPALVINFAVGGSNTMMISILLVYALAQVLDIILIIPFVVAKIIDLHPVTVVLIVIFGAHLGGILGMIISIPVFSVLKVSSLAIYRQLTDFRG